MSDIVERLRGLADLFEAGDAPRHVVLHMRAGADEIERLRAALREAYEVYAGSDGFIPETAGEGYQQQIIRQMVNCISAALGGVNGY